MSKNDKKDSNIKGKIATGAVTVAVASVIALVESFSNVNTEDEMQKQLTATVNIQDEPIKLEDTKDYKVIKVKSGGCKIINHMYNKLNIKYYIVKEFPFPYSKDSDIKNLYTLIDINKNETVLYRNKDGQVIDEDSGLQCIELGSLTDYLVKYDYIKEEYKPSELQENIIEKLEKENSKKEKIDFYDTTEYDILKIENEETGKSSYHLVLEWPNPVMENNDVYYHSVYEDIEKGKDILEVDEFGVVTDDYKQYSYCVLGSLADYLVTYNAVKPEYDTQEFTKILNKIRHKDKPAEKIK